MSKYMPPPLTVCVFRKFKDGTIIALFPAEINYPDGSCESYQHIGQHGPATYDWVIKLTKRAKFSEYEPLKKELENRGYTLRCVFKFIKKRGI